MQNHDRFFVNTPIVTTTQKAARRLFAACLLSGILASQSSAVWAQQGTKPGTGTGKQNNPATPKLSAKEKEQEKAREIFADAANAQNNSAFPLAIEQWNRLLKEYPSDPLVSSARHFLGVCHLQKESPDFEAAIAEFKISLQDVNLKQREESLVNLGWTLYQQGVSAEGDLKKQALAESTKVLAALIEKYPDGSFTDKALFYAGESESRLGNLERAIGFYSQLVQNRSMDASSVRPDALFGLGLTYDEQKQSQLAKESYEKFLAKYSTYSLTSLFTDE